MTLLVRHPPGHDAERAYVLDVVLGERLGLAFEASVEERDDVLITDGTSSVAVPDALFATPEADWLTARGRRSPEDVFGEIFAALTRYDELVDDARDRHGRHPGTPCERPFVDDLVETLRERLTQSFGRLETRRSTFRVLPSHDVDVPRCPSRRVWWTLRTAALDVVKRRDVGLAARRLDPREDPCDTFDFLLDASERRGLQSTFFFMAGVTSPAHDGGYSLDSPCIRALIRRIHERGHQLGLHPSYETLRDAETIRAELERLRAACAAEGVEQEAWGGRQHYLRWKSPVTWRAYAEAGLAYDSSLHFPDHPGFRAGTCFDYPVFDLERRERLAVREVPLVAMEASFLQYLGLSHEQAYDRMVELKRHCRRVGGAFTFLWHNDRLQSARDRALYEAVLDA